MEYLRSLVLKISAHCFVEDFQMLLVAKNIFYQIKRDLKKDVSNWLICNQTVSQNDLYELLTFSHAVWIMWLKTKSKQTSFVIQYSSNYERKRQLEMFPTFEILSRNMTILNFKIISKQKMRRMHETNIFFINIYSTS